MSEARARAAEIARASYGRLLAILAARTGDIQRAEEALADAFRLALEHWPETGVPPNPEGWLVLTAKRRATDARRRVVRSPVATVETVPDIEAAFPDEDAIPDRRLALMFVCAHPAIDASVHTPLMLQTVLGFEAADIGRSFLVSPSAIAQRLVRAKRKIRDARIAFELPEREELATRLEAVLEAVYGAYALDWLHDPAARDMTGEALFLAEILADLLPSEPEAAGLAALLGFLHARRAARLVDDVFVPLDEQDVARWDAAMIARANLRLSAAGRRRTLGRFQLEAAIQAAHVRRGETGTTDWRAILHLTEGLCRFWPTLGAAINRAAAVGELFGPDAGLAALGAVDATSAASFQPFHATRAHLCARAGRREEALVAFETAIALTPEPAVRRWLELRRGQTEAATAGVPPAVG